MGWFWWGQGSTSDPVWKAALGKKPAQATSCCPHPHTSAVGSSPKGSGHPIPISSPPLPTSRRVTTLQVAKLHLINWVELELSTSSRVKYRFSLLAGDGLVVHSVDRGSTKVISCTLSKPNGDVVFCCTQERKLFPLTCLFQGCCQDSSVPRKGFHITDQH